MRMFDWHKAYFQTEDDSLRDTRATMATLASYANFTDNTCFPSQRTLSRLLGCSTETIRRHIKTNIEAGWVRKIRDGNSHSVTNKYEFVIPTPLTHEGSPSSNALRPADSPHARGVTPLTHEGSTPLTGVGLTTKTTTQGTTQQSGSAGLEIPSDPFGGSVAVINLPSTNTTTEETPLTHEGSSPHADEGGGDLAEVYKRNNPHLDVGHKVILWPADKQLPADYHPDDPFKSTTYIDDETGAALTA